MSEVCYLYIVMKTLLFTLLVFACAIPLRADNWLKNGDFTDGLNHWEGDGKPPSDFAPDDPLATPDPFTSKGLIVRLKRQEWTKVAQDFNGNIASGTLTITYMVSPDLTFSDTLDDYVNMPHQIGYNAWRPFNTAVGNWVLLMSDFASLYVTYYQIQPKLGSSGPQTYQRKVRGLTPGTNKTVTLAFPPGTGKVVILNVSLTSDDQQNQ